MIIVVYSTVVVREPNNKRVDFYMTLWYSQSKWYTYTAVHMHYRLLSIHLSFARQLKTQKIWAAFFCRTTPQHRFRHTMWKGC
jgi:hypothetical protein